MLISEMSSSYPWSTQIRSVSEGRSDKSFITAASRPGSCTYCLPDLDRDYPATPEMGSGPKPCAQEDSSPYISSSALHGYILHARTPSPLFDQALEDCDSYMSEPMHVCPFGIDTCTGCTGLSTDSFENDSSRSSRSTLTSSQHSLLDDESLPNLREMLPTPSLMSFNSPAVNRIQMKEELLRLYFPAGMFETDFMYSKFLSRESLEGMGPTMDAAIDTLSLFHVGTAHSDRRLVGEARNRYTTAVMHLDLDLARPDAMFDEGVLGAIYLLGFCELFRPLSFRTQSWRPYHKGLRDMLLSRGPDARYSKFGQLLVYNFRHLAAVVGCAERKKTDVAGQGWKQCAALTDGYMTALSEHIIRVPEVLERADQAMSRRKLEATEVFQVLIELSDVERHMQAWLLHYYRSFDRLPYWTEKVEKFPHFQRHCQAVRGVFPKALRFPSFSYASAQTTYWIALLQLKQTIFEINRRYRVPILPKAEAVLVAETNECADRLCESVAYLTQSCYGTCGILRATAPLHYSSVWYGKQNHTGKVAWCGSVGQSLEKIGNMLSLYQHSEDGWEAEGAGSGASATAVPIVGSG